MRRCLTLFRICSLSWTSKEDFCNTTYPGRKHRVCCLRGISNNDEMLSAEAAAVCLAAVKKKPSCAECSTGKQCELRNAARCFLV